MKKKEGGKAMYTRAPALDTWGGKKGGGKN